MKPGNKMSQLVIEKVMRWKLISLGDNKKPYNMVWVDSKGAEMRPVWDFSPSTDRNDAMFLLDHVGRSFDLVTINHFTNCIPETRRYRVKLINDGDLESDISITGYAATLAEAICIAILKAYSVASSVNTDTKDPEIMIEDLIREFERGNFRHVNDTTNSGKFSMAYCDAVVKHLKTKDVLEAPKEIPFNSVEPEPLEKGDDDD